MKNKRVKQMICDVLNQNGRSFGYYSLIKPSGLESKAQRNSYALREFGIPHRLSKAAVLACLD